MNRLHGSISLLLRGLAPAACLAAVATVPAAALVVEIDAGGASGPPPAPNAPVLLASSDGAPDGGSR